MRMHQTVLTKLWHISHPHWYGYLVGSFLIGAATGAQSLQDFQHTWFWILACYFLVPANLLAYGMMELFEADPPAGNPKPKPRHLLLKQSERNLLQICLLVIGISTALLAVQMTLLYLFLLCLFVLTATVYLAPPVRLKHRPFFDMFSFTFYLIPGVLGYSFFTTQLPGIAVISAGLAWTAGWQLYSAVSNIAADLHAGHSNTATLLGARRTLLIVLALWIIFAGLSSWLLPLPWNAVLWAYPILAVFSLLDVRHIEQRSWIFPTITALIGLGAIGSAIFALL